MPETKQFTVHGDNGLTGVMFASARFLDTDSERIVKLNDGTELRVAADALEPRPDGSFYLHLKPEDIPNRAAERPASAPPGQESKMAVNGPLFRDSYEVEHRSIERLLDEPVSERHEGDVLILPVIEEVLVVEKKYLLKEEIHIRKRREEVSDIRTVRRGNGSGKSVQ